MSTDDKYDALAQTAGSAAGLGPEQIPGLAHILRKLARDERERCARVAEQKVTRVSFEKPGGEVEVYKWKDGPEIAAAIRALT